MYEDLYSEIANSLAPLANFGFGDPAIEEPNRGHLRIRISNGIVQIRFDLEYGDLSMIAHFIGQQRGGPKFPSDAAPLGEALGDDPRIKPFHEQRLSDAAFLAALRSYSQTLAERASDLLRGDRARVRELQLEQFRRAIEYQLRLSQGKATGVDRSIVAEFPELQDEFPSIRPEGV